MKLVKDEVGGYRVKGTGIIVARYNECRCCWYVFDQETAETVQGAIHYFNDAKSVAFEYAEKIGA